MTGVVRRDGLREAVLALHFPEKRYQPHPDAEWSVSDPEDCEDEDGNVVTDPHVFEVCAHCGSLEMLSDQHDPGDECPHAYQDSLWPCATARVLDAAPDVPPTEACVCGEPNTLGVVHREDGPCYLPVVPPDPPVVDREKLARELRRHIGAHADIVANDLLTSGVLVAAADVRAGALEDAADAIEAELDAFRPRRIAARWVVERLLNRAEAEREGDGL